MGMHPNEPLQVLETGRVVPTACPEAPSCVTHSTGAHLLPNPSILSTAATCTCIYISRDQGCFNPVC